MELEDLIKELSNVFRNHFASMGIVSTNNEAKKFTDAIAFFANLYKRDEYVKSIVDFGEIETLNEYITSKTSELWARYSPLTDIINTYLKEKDYDNLSMFMITIYNDIMIDNDDEYSELYNAKTRLVNDYFEDIMEHKYERIINYFKEIDRYSHLSLLLQKSVDFKYKNSHKS